MSLPQPAVCAEIPAEERSWKMGSVQEGTNERSHDGIPGRRHCGNDTIISHKSPNKIEETQLMRRIREVPLQNGENKSMVKLSNGVMNTSETV
jgi:hypothetical protein